MAAATGRMLRECHSMGIPMVGAIKPPFERARLSSTGRGRIPQLPVEPHVNGLGVNLDPTAEVVFAVLI